MHGQTTTTNTDCNVYDNRVNCTSTSTDNSAAIRAQQERQAEQDRANEQAGAAVGKAMGSAMNGLIGGHKIKSYCKQHAGESYTWTWPDGRKQEGVCPGTVVGIENYCKHHTGEPYHWSWPNGRKQEGTCPGTLVVTKEKLIEASNSTFRAEKVVGYAESSGDTFTIHSERASDMRFHMILANKQQMQYFRMAGIKTFVYTNDSDQRFTYDLVADHVVTPGGTEAAPAAVPAAALAAVPALTPSAKDEAETSLDAGPSDTATKAVASNIPQGAPAVAPAASAPTTATGTADTPKPCFTDKLGHTVCLAQH
jgi:hypothetical protein